MGIKVNLKAEKIIDEYAKINSCYMVTKSGVEIKVTQEMVHLALNQILARCNKHSK